MTLVEAATAADVDAVARLETNCLGDDAWSRGLVEEGIGGRLPTVQYVVAREAPGGEPVGHAVVSVAGDIAELQRIAVAKPQRRKGIASLLLEAVVAQGGAAGADRLLLEVRADNTAALAFYATHGFVEIDRRPRYYRDGAEAVVLRLGLAAGCGGAA